MATEHSVELDLVHGYFKQYPKEVAQSVEASGLDEALPLLAALDTEHAVSLLERLSPTIGAELLRQLLDDQLKDVIQSMDPGYTATLLSQMDESDRERLLGLTAGPLGQELRELMAYPPDTAGALMDTRVITFGPDTTVSEALSRLRRRQIETEALVVCDEGKLRGMIQLTQAVLAEPDSALSALISGLPIHVMATAPREDVVTVLQQTDITLLPVVDPHLRLLGCINYNSLMRAVQEEATANLQTLVGVSKDEHALSTPWFAVRKRLPWLNINLLTAFLAAAVVGLFEDTIAKFTALAVLLPVVAGQSGNTGAQALAVTMRGLALREIRLRHSFGVLTKETLAGFINGVAIAIVTCIGVYIWSGSLGLCLVIGLAMVISMVLAGLSGAAIPLLLTVFRQDPAQSGSIVLTTVTDIAGFFSFLGLATIFAALL